jgi:hypothetical protein
VSHLRGPSVKTIISSGLTTIDGLIAYLTFNMPLLKVLHCGDANCTENNEITTVDSVEDVGHYPSLALDSEDNPVISYLDFTNDKLKVLHCGNNTCTVDNSIALIGQSNAGYFSSIVLDTNDYPIVSYYDMTHSTINILKCGNMACNKGNSILAPDTSVQVGQHTSLQLDINDYPVVSYYDAENGHLKLLHCSNATCNPNTEPMTNDVMADEHVN